MHANATTRAVYRSSEAAERVHGKYCRLLDNWPVPSEQLRIPTREGETFVIASGPRDAEVVILLHGTMATSATWMREVAAWAARYRVFAVDLIGDAGLSVPSRPPMGGDIHALWLDDVLEGLGVARASFVGLSLGGWLALDYAIRRPARLGKLVLMTPAGLADRNILVWALPLLLLGSWGARKVRERIVGRFPPPMSDEARAFAELSDDIFKSMRPRSERPPVFTDEALAEIEIPVLVLLGEHDPTMDSQRIARRIEHHVRNSSVVTLPGARHYLGDQSERVLAFLERDEERAGSVP